MNTIYSRDIPGEGDDKVIDLTPFVGGIVTSAKFYAYDKVVLTFDTGDVLEIYEESQAGDISVRVSPWAYTPPKE